MPRLVLRKQRADRERRLGALAVEVLTALGERDGASPGRGAARRLPAWSPRRSHTPRHRARPRRAARRPTASSAGARAGRLGVAVLQQLDQLLQVHDHVYLSWLSAFRSLRRESHQSRSSQEESQLSISKEAQYRRRLTLRWSRAGIRVCPTGQRAKAVDSRPEAALSWLRRDVGSSRSKPGSSSPQQGAVSHARKAVDKSPQESDQQVSCERFWPRVRA